MTPEQRARAAAAAEDLHLVSGLTLRVVQDRGLHGTLREMVGEFFGHSSTLEYLLGSAAWGPSEIRVVCSAAPEQTEKVMAKAKFGEGRKPNEWEEGLSSEALVAWREEHGLTRTAVAKLLGTSTASVSAWENGRAPGPGYQAKMHELLAGPPPGEDEEPEEELGDEEDEGDDDQGEVEEELEEEEEPELAPRPARRKRAPARQLPAAVEAPAAPVPLPSWRALALGVLARAARGAAAIAGELERRAGASS